MKLIYVRSGRGKHTRYEVMLEPSHVALEQGTVDSPLEIGEIEKGDVGWDYKILGSDWYEVPTLSKAKADCEKAVFDLIKANFC